MLGFNPSTRINPVAMIEAAEHKVDSGLTLNSYGRRKMTRSNSTVRGKA